MEPLVHPAGTGNVKASIDRIEKMRSISVKLEATFLSEMLKSAGLGAPSASFGGGAGEEQYSSFLVEAQAAEIAQAGGIGLSEIVFTELMERYRNDPR